MGRDGNKFRQDELFGEIDQRHGDRDIGSGVLVEGTSDRPRRGGGWNLWKGIGWL